MTKIKNTYFLTFETLLVKGFSTLFFLVLSKHRLKISLSLSSSASQDDKDDEEDDDEGDDDDEDDEEDTEEEEEDRGKSGDSLICSVSNVQADEICSDSLM